MIPRNKISIRILPVLHGDAICLQFFGNDGRNHNIFIDGGFATTYSKAVKPEVEKILQANEKIDLFILTHTDKDHISGVIQFAKEYGEKGIVDKYWFNYSCLDVQLWSHTNEISIMDGITFRNYLIANSMLPEHEITSEMVVNLYGAEIRVLSPTKFALEKYKVNWQKVEEDQDYSSLISGSNDYGLSIEQLSKEVFREDVKLENRVSIAFIIEIYGKSILFLADSHPSVIVNTLMSLGFSKEHKLRVDYVKLSHHGSKHNTNNELLSLLDCDKFIISANGKNRHSFPHKEALARVIRNSERNSNKHLIFYFNYDNDVLRSIFTKDEMLNYNFSCIFPNENKHGAIIRL
jgi:beta-lactamase superfamily II metal-dependent hydrolase